MTFDLRSLLQTLNQRGVRYVVIGGVAVAAHGYVRATGDLDFIPDPDHINLEKLAKALSSLGATLPTASGRLFNAATDLRVMLRGGNLTADTRFGGLDIVRQASGAPPYDDLEKDAIQSTLFGEAVLICSLKHLRAMKEAQGRPQDALDLEHLPKR